jgi:hypothetical protein
MPAVFQERIHQADLARRELTHNDMARADAVVHHQGGQYTCNARASIIDGRALS